MHGDFEAQRHWQEITVNLKVQDWYENSTKNDLQYWGFDYPPLTAYHSYICGLLAYMFDPGFVELNTSRGIETYHHKLFMRYTVLFSDLLIFIPAVIVALCLCNRAKGELILPMSYSWLSLLYYPGLYLIDYGHFQYNTVSLGLFIWTVVSFQYNHFVVGSVFFCCALNYKQMELYHAPPVFFYLLGKVFSSNFKNGASLLIKLGTTVVLTFVFIWLPYVGSVSSLLQVVSRVFPVNRGVFED
jgi:alpha-1,3-glucosyltransferase